MEFKKWTVLIIALHVVAVAWFVFIGGDPQRPDTERYLLLASKICQSAPYESPAERYRTGYFSPDNVDESFSEKQNLKPNAPEIFRTPGYPVFLCVLDKIGFDSDYGIVVGQLLLLYLCVACFHVMATRLYGRRITDPATLALLVSPGGLVYSLTLYSEVLFLFFLMVAVLAFLVYLKEFVKTAFVVSAIFFALAFYVRAGVIYIPILLSLLTLLFMRQQFAQKARHMLVFVVIFAACISPWVARNYSHYGKVYISAQLSNTLAIWHLPDVWENTKGVPPNTSRMLIRAEIDTLVEQYENDNQTYLDNIEFFNLQQEYANTRLLHDWQAYAQRWAIGMWSTATGGYLSRLYYMFSGEPLLPLRETAKSIEHEFIVFRLFTAMAQEPIETMMKVLIHLEKLLWIIAVALALIPVTAGVIRLDVSAWVILAVVSYFIFIPGTMGYSRFRFAVDWLIILQAFIGANILYHWLNGAYQKSKEG